MNDASWIIRTGAALQFACGAAMAASQILVCPAGLAREAAGTARMAAATSLPGAIGAPRRPQPGPRPESTVPADVQPVEIRGPEGIGIAVETAAGWSPVHEGGLRMGLVVGQPYRLQITRIPGHDGRELFPSVRLLAKLAVPPGMAWRFPVEIVLDADDLDRAVAGAHVRRVVYSACDPGLPDVTPDGWFDVRPGDDCLDVAATLGDPLAEVVIGNRVPATHYEELP